MKILLSLCLIVFLTGCHSLLPFPGENVKLRAGLARSIAVTSTLRGAREYPLILALTNRDMGLFRYLLENGADVNAVDYTGCGALNAAVGYKDFEATEKLLELGAYPNVPSINPLNTIGSTGGFGKPYSYKIAKLLLDHGAVLTPSKRDNTTPLFYVYDYDTAKLYLEKGVDINHKDNYGQTAFMHLVDAVYGVHNVEGPIKMMELFIQHGADINVVPTESDRGTALDRAIQLDLPEMVLFLRQHGAKTAEELRTKNEAK